MRMLHFLPLTFLAGVHGFAFFAPYLAVFLTAVVCLRRHRRAAPRAVPVPISNRPTH
ncbi:MAG: hypothetical protein IT448_00665 [Phycisphaerales bacterium]|nr:hypothetical protein [Phycisphaerales bacterium]